MKKRKILIVTHYSTLLGANRSLLSLVTSPEYFSKYYPIVLVPQLGDLTKELDKRNIQYYTFHFRASTFDKKSFLDSIKGLLREVLNIYYSIILFFLLRDKHISIVHTNSSVTNIGAYLSILLKIPHIWHFREFAKQHFHWSFNWGDNFQYYLYRKHAKIIIVISKSLQEYYLSVLPSSDIRLVYNGVKLRNEKSPVSRRMDKIGIALVGILHPSKHQDIVIKAIDRLVNGLLVDNIHLYIYGDFSEDSSYKSLILGLVDSCNLHDYITFCGYQNNIEDCISYHHIGVLASEYEAFGRVTIEYMLCKLVPVVSNSGANTEIVTNRVNGLIFDLNNVEQLAGCMLEILKDCQLYENLSRNAKDMASSRFSLESCVKSIMIKYDELLA